MRDCIVLGSGRSGTSMVAGSLAQAGYFMGEALHRPRISNPKGFFEAPEVNAINEELLAAALAGAQDPGPGRRWLALPPRAAVGEMPAALRPRAEALVRQRPFCFKDPRFSSTLPAWRPLLGAARFVCVFRDPALTATSLCEEARRAAYLAGFELSLEQALELWRSQYERLLEEQAAGGEWLFLHYDQVLGGEGLERLEAFLGARVDRTFPDRRLRRTEASCAVPAGARELYARLCERAGYVPAGDAPAAARPRVSVLAVLSDADRASGEELLEDVRAQRGVAAELVVVDATRAGDLALPGAVVVRHAGPSRGRALAAAAERAAGDLLALAVPGCRMLPARLAAAAEALAAAPGTELVAADLYLCDAHGQFQGRSSPAVMGEAPGPFFEAGLVLRRGALTELDRRAFVPAELDLYLRLAARGRVAFLDEPAGTVERRRHDAAWERSRQDAALASLLAREPLAAPELTVSLCTYQRREVLAECLEAFARQLLVPGTFELVVVDDGSSDGTAEWLDELELAVPLCVVHQENRGLAAARNAGLELARGRLVLFVNDDTLPFPDCVERHLAAHARAGGPVCVLGTFEQPAEALDNALMRHLEGSTEVFAYSRLKAGERYDGLHLWTCNASAPLAAVRAAGAFDPSFRHYGCEDSDLGLRLERAGLAVLYEPRARALHRHLLDLDALARRQRQVARAYVRLARKHPQVLRRWGNEGLEGAWLAEQVALARPALEPLERAARQLARIDLAALEASGAPHDGTAREVATALAEVLRRLDRLWWWQGYLDGLAEHGLTGFAELARSEDPHPFSGADPSDPAAPAARPRRLLAFPRWDDDAELEGLMDAVAPAAGFATLVLRYDPARDGERAVVLERLEAAYAARLAPGAVLDVLLEEAPLDRAGLMRLGRSVDALLVGGGPQRPELAAVCAERLAGAAQVAAWRRRFEGSAPCPVAAPSAFRPRLELSVVVPTRDRPRQVLGLLERLAAQDLEPDRFEVLVVDDGSREPLGAGVLSRPWPFELVHLSQAPSGPAAARNRALAVARGELVLFLNDDAVPLVDCLRRHVEAHAHAHAARPRAVLGTFQLLERHVRDSLAWHVETTTALFAQPRMQAGVHYEGVAFCTGNLSVPRAALVAAGGFDAGLPHAGGEDTELGLRLFREQGLRVVYDPRIRCGHDHPLDLDSLVQRHQVLGWVAYQIHRRHPDAGLVPSWPPTEETWRGWAREDEEDAASFDGLFARVAAILSEERAAGRGPIRRALLRDSFQALQDHAFRAGLLRAHWGQGALAPRRVPAGV